MGKGARMDVVRQIKRLLWKWEVGGLLNQGDIGGNTKKWTEPMLQRERIGDHRKKDFTWQGTYNLR